jgi:hypothetical protein
LLSEWQTVSARTDHERISRARQVAEDLFKPRQETASADVPTSASDAASSAEHQPQRQPRFGKTDDELACVGSTCASFATSADFDEIRANRRAALPWLSDHFRPFLALAVAS